MWNIHLLKAKTFEDKIASVKAIVNSEKQVLAAEEQAGGRGIGGETLEKGLEHLFCGQARFSDSQQLY